MAMTRDTDPGRHPPSSTEGRPGRPTAPLGDYRVEVETSHAGARRLVPEWRALWEASGDRNPFLQPEWMLAWADLHVGEGSLAVASVRRGTELAAVAPFHISGGRGIRMLLPLGCGPGFELTEVPGIVSDATDRRRVLAVLVEALAERSDGWDWARLTLSPDDGWLAPHWLPAAERPVSAMHHQTRACVVLDLAPTWDAQRMTLKRNMRESLRRSHNRLERLGSPWGIRVESVGPGWPAAVAELCRLHALRASAPGRIAHPDWSADPKVAALLTTAAGMLPQGALEIAFLDLDGEAIAAQATLSGGGTTYLLMSGFDPEWWSLGPVTELVGAVARAAIARGDRRLNLSSGPTVAKLRWSEHLELHQDFVLVGARARSRAAFAGYWSLAALRRFRRESGLHRRIGS